MMNDSQLQSGIRKEQDLLAAAYRRATNTRRPSRKAQTMEALRAEVLRPIGHPTTHETALDDEFPPRRGEETDDDFQIRKDIFEEMKRAKEDYHAQKEDKVPQYDHLVGRCFIHPLSKRLYEVVRVYWNRRQEVYAAYRQPADGEPGYEEDRHSFRIEGPSGVKELTHLYSKRAGDLNQLFEWPQTEYQMLTIQRQDPVCRDILIKLEIQRETMPDLTVYKGEKREGKVSYYQPVLVTGERGALRVTKADQGQQDGPTLGELGEEQGMGHLEDDPVYLPYPLISAAMRYYHDAMGHPGGDRLHRSLKLKYFWIGMQTEAKTHVNACRQCKLRKAIRGQAKVPNQTLPIPSRPFQRVYIDLIQCITSSEGSNYVCVMQDALTKWVELVPLRDKRAETIAEAITNAITLRHGCIEDLVTDKGTEFRNHTVRDLNMISRTSHHMTTTANPQANSVERFNGILKDMISMFVTGHQSDWDKYLPVVAHTYRVTVNTSTGYSPFRLLYGREAKLPTDSWIMYVHKEGDHTLSDYVRDLTAALIFSWGQSTQAIMQRAEGMKERLQQQLLDAKPHGRLFRQFNVGQRFYLKTVPRRYFISEEDKLKYKLSSSLQNRYTGPHEVLSVINPVVYVAAVDGALRLVHANKMKRETHNDDEVHIRTTGNRISPFLQKLPVTEDNERTRAQLPDFLRRTMDEDGYQKPLPEDSADVFVGSMAPRDTTAARIREPILINDSSNDDSTISGETQPLDPPSDDES